MSSASSRQDKATRSMKQVLKALTSKGQEGFLGDTPARFVAYLEEFNREVPAEEELNTFFQNEGDHRVDQMIVESSIPFRAMCAHHLLPFYGTVDIGYIPRERIVGLSKLARAVEAAGVRKPNIQETITQDIAEALQSKLHPRGVIVVMRATHTCMSIRGIAARGVITITSALKGAFLDNVQIRTEFFELCKGAK